MTGQGSFWDTAETGRYQPAQLWYDATDQRLVVLVNGVQVPVVEPVLPGLEVVPDVAHVSWSDAPDPVSLAHIASCQECQAKFGGRILGGGTGAVVGKHQRINAGKDPKLPGI